MNNINLLAFLLTLQTQTIQHPALKQLLAYLQSEPLDWVGIQEKINTLLAAHSDLQPIYSQFRDQLVESPDLLKYLPWQEKLDTATTRSALPTLPDKENNKEIRNLAVVILRSDNLQQAAQQHLHSLSEQLNRDKR